MAGQKKTRPRSFAILSNFAVLILNVFVISTFLSLTNTVRYKPYLTTSQSRIEEPIFEEIFLTHMVNWSNFTNFSQENPEWQS